MPHTKLLLSILILPLCILGQTIDNLVAYDQKLLDRFYKSTTYIVLDQHSESSYSKEIREIAKEVWKITPMEVVDMAAFAELSKDKTKSFLTREFISGDKDLISLSLYMGGQKQMETKGILISNVKLKHYSATDEDFLYKLSTLLLNIQWKVSVHKEKKIEDAAGFDAYVEKQLSLLHQKKLYILKEHLTNKISTEAELKKFYRHEVAVVTKDVLTDAIQTRDSTVAYLSIVAPVKNWGGQTAYYRVFSADKGETLVSYNRAVSGAAPVGVTGYDLKKFNK